MRTFLFSSLIAVPLLAGAALASGQEVRGPIGSFDRTQGSFTLFGDMYTLPTAYPTIGLGAGDRVLVSWEQQGQTRLVRDLYIEQNSSDDDQR